jgi:hypothetical protein
MTPEIKQLLTASRPPEDLRDTSYDVGFYAIGYERRSRYIASYLSKQTKSLIGFEYRATELAFNENKAWAHENEVKELKLGDYRVDRENQFAAAVGDSIATSSSGTTQKQIFVDVSSMDRSLIARLLNSIFTKVSPPFTLRILYAPASFHEPTYAFTPVRECAPSIPELSGELGVHQSSLTLLLGLGFEFGVSLGLLQQLEADYAIIFVPEGADPRYDKAVKKANFELDFGLQSARVFPYHVKQPIATFDSLFSLSASASVKHRVVVAPNGPKIFAALATVVGLFRAPHVTVLRASLASSAPTHHVEADGSIVAIDFVCA